MCKWIWRFANEMDFFRRNVIYWTFGEERSSWCSTESRGAYGTSAWKEIRKEWDIISVLVVFSLGNGRRLHFWKDACHLTLLFFLLWRGVEDQKFNICLLVALL